MESEVFRFTAVRQPQLASSDESIEKSVRVYSPSSETPFVAALRDARAGGRNKMTTESMKIRRRKSYVSSMQHVPGGFSKLYDYLLANQELITTKKLETTVADTFSKSSSTITTENQFRTLRQQVADSFLADLVIGDTSSQEQSSQAQLLRLFGLLERLATTSSSTIAVAAALSAALVLPKNVFPLPTELSDLSDAVRKDNDQSAKDLASFKAKRIALINEISDLKTAFGEVQEKMEDERLSAKVDPKKRTTSGGFFINPAVANQLTTKTKSVVGSLNFSTSKLDASALMPKMERKISDLSAELHRNTGGSSPVVRYGNVMVAEPYGEMELVDWSNEHPGPCKTTTPAIDADTDAVTIPQGMGTTRVLGIMDLLRVKQDLVTYEKGEIAHIENVLTGETRSRKHRKLSSRQETVLSELEETEDQENSLTSAERYELQVESQNVIEESLSFDAGVLANIYGISYDIAASANVAGSTTTTDVSSSSSRFARDITNRAVNRITSRQLKSRTVTTTEEIEEKNLHSFTNAAGPDISGVYRWLDKIYDAQVIRYGKRLLLEFVVPEPAAFFRFAQREQPIEDVVLLKPDEPGYCVGGKRFRPLSAKDITRDNYLMWASKYNVSNMDPPPPSYKIVGESFASEDSSRLQNKHGDSTYYYHAEKAKIPVPAGYYPEKAKINFDTVLIDQTGIGPAGANNMTVQIEDAELNTKSTDNTIYLSEFSTANLPLSITSYNIVSYGVTVTVFCRLSKEKYEEWKQSAFVAIMEAYNDLKSRYEAALQAEKISQGLRGISGRNPLFNRETEQTELKKGCISLLTGQRFEEFNSVRRNVYYHGNQYGYPEIVNFDDANAEGNYIQFFEQAIEWRNMLYVFYPYFWAEKSQWITLSQLSDNDALFEQFLKAGSARVQVPVRPGFEFALQTYLATGLLWQSEGALIDENEDGVPDELQVSIIAELKEGLLATDSDGSGEPVGEKWPVRIPTSLVIIEDNPSSIIS